MSARTDYLKQKYCNETLKIWIYPTPVGAIKNVKIVIEKKGVKNIGKIEYSQNPTANQPKYETIIQKLYNDYYELNFKVK